VKLTYELESAGHLSGLAAEQEPLSNGDNDDDGIVRPSDFAETKSACDVVLTGRALAEVGPMRFRVGSVDRSVPRASMLGPTQASADEPCAPPEQRIAFPALPLEIMVQGDGQVVKATLPGPVPGVAVIEGDWSSRVTVPMRADTILVDTRLGTCSVVFRGEFHLTSVDAEATLVVDALGRLPKTPMRELKRWPRRQVTLPDEINLDDDDDLQITVGRSVGVPPDPRHRTAFDDETTGIVPALEVRKTRTVRMRTSEPATAMPASAPASAPASGEPARLPENHTLPAIPLWVTPPTLDGVAFLPAPAEGHVAAPLMTDAERAQQACAPGPHDAHTRPMPLMDSLAARLVRAPPRAKSEPPLSDGLHSMPTVEMPALSGDLAAARPTQAGVADEPETPAEDAASIEAHSGDTDEERPIS